jgi:superfamily II DNA or RNA helicase
VRTEPRNDPREDPSTGSVFAKGTAEYGRLFPPDFRFRLPWRTYQSRILGEFDRHIADGHFHLVAAPGSGKTVLGLEVVRLLGKPALICAPTLALRAQWIERLVVQFLGGTRPGWISEEVNSPALLTFETYQALHTRAKRDGVESLVRTLRAAGVGTLVFDEAHHLKQEWWRTLDTLHRALSETCVVALTATPPYDVPQAEWNRYLNLAGAVDAEISAAELVLTGDLCPHQDSVYLQGPTPREIEQVTAFGRRVASFLSELSLDQELVGALLQHRALVDPEGQLETFLDQPEYVLSLAVFLRHAHGVVPEKFLEALGIEQAALPPFDPWWAERLLHGVLFSDEDAFPGQRDHLRALRHRLQQMGAIERRKVHLLSSPANERSLRASPTKFRAIADIVEAENRGLGDDLRLLVLTEHIREHELEADAGSLDSTSRIGVIPLFDHLRRLRLPGVKLCAVTGRVGIIPSQIVHEVEAALPSESSDRPRSIPLLVAPEYHRVALAGEDAAILVRVVTRAFQEGRLNAIVGTTALLGEGWDAPALNTLVLATTIGSYVSTNQSRGRALRKNPEVPSKTANIWHPVCIDPNWVATEESELALLHRRFATFMAPRYDVPVIESGLARTGLNGALAPEAIDAMNASTFQRAEARGDMAALWKLALAPAGHGDGRPVRQTRLPRRLAPKVVVPFLDPHGRLGNWFMQWRLRRRMIAVARAITEGLVDAEAIDQTKQRVEFGVVIRKETVTIQTLGLDTRGEMLLHQAMQDVFCPLSSPRYLLAGRSGVYPVPRVLGESRKNAEAFCHRWRRRMGRVRLVATRSTEGKRLLLHAVQRYLVNHCREGVDTGMTWVAGTAGSTADA